MKLEPQSSFTPDNIALWQASLSLDLQLLSLATTSFQTEAFQVSPVVSLRYRVGKLEG